MEAATEANDIVEGLAANDRNAQLEAVRGLKKLFRPPDRIFSRLKLESLLESARVSLENKTPEADSLHGYGSSLVGFLGEDPALNSEILRQVEIISGELKKKDERLTDRLMTKLWRRLGENSVGHPDGVLDASKPTLERTVLEWVADGADDRLELLSGASADSAKLFQTLTSILYEVSVRTRGRERVFEVTASFLEAVKRECRKRGKSFLGLYPKECRRLVSLMRCPPELLGSDEGSDDHLAKEVVSSLSEVFFTDRKRALILLSHFTQWIRVFKVHLEESDI